MRMLFGLLGLLCAASVSATEHPNLWFGKSEIPALQQKIKDASLQEHWSRVQKAALNPPKDFDIRGVQAGGLAYNLTGDAKFAKPAIQILMKIAKDTSWPTRKGTGHGDIKWCGLETGTNCKVLGTGYDLLYHAMSEAERKTVRDCLVERVWPKYLAAFHKMGDRGNWVDADGHFEWWTGTYANWAAWLTGGVGVSALAFYEEEPLAKQVVEKVQAGFRNHYRGYSQKNEDGGYDEGPMYWGTSFAHGVYYHVALERVTGSDQGYFKLPGIALTPQFLIDFSAPDGRLVAFNDCNFILPSFVPAELFFTGVRYNQPSHLWIADSTCPDWYEQAFALLWRPAGPTPPAPAKGEVRWYRDVSFAVLRTANLYVPFKGGELSCGHGQLDAGNFLVYAGKDRLLNDPGYGKIETAVHNTLLVDGKGQRKNGRYDGGEPSSAYASIEKCARIGPDRYLACDVTSCYDQPLTLFKRHLLVTDEDFVIIFDEMTAGKPATFTLNLHTDKKISENSGFEKGATIESGSSTAHVTVIGEGGSKNTVGSSGAGKALSASSPGPRTAWRAFTVLATRPGAVPALKAEFASGRAVLSVGGLKFTFEQRGGAHVYVPRSGSEDTNLAGICPGVGGAPTQVVTASASAPRPPAQTQASPRVPEKPAPVQAKPQPKVSEEDLQIWVRKLHDRIREKVAGGEKPRIYLKIFGDRAEPVKVMDANEKQLNVNYKGNTLPFEWEKLGDAENCMNLALAFTKEGQAEDHVILAVFMLANGKSDEGETQLARAISIDPEVGRVAAMEVRSIFGGM
ncbi:MAG: heparinase II/III family protein [Planctomycetota bacterium]|nr:heparinase II/III family protein [Planctomycetota bacterium]